MDCSMPGFPFTISWSLLRLMSIESVMLSNHLILCRPFSSSPQSFPASESFPMNWIFTSGGQSIRASASALVLLVNIQGWFPLGLTGLIFLLLKGLSRFFSSTTVGKHQFFDAQPPLSNSHICKWLLENVFYGSVKLVFILLTYSKGCFGCSHLRLTDFDTASQIRSNSFL